MSEVNRSSFIAELTDSRHLSPQLSLVPEISESTQPVSIETFTNVKNPLNEQIHSLIEDNKKWLYGYKTAGADVPATQESKLKGLRNIISGFEPYEQFKTSAPIDLVRNARLLSATRDIAGNKVSVHDMYYGKEDIIIESLFWNLVGRHDPLIIALAQIGEQRSMSQSSFDKLVKDSLTAFHPAEIKQHIKTQTFQYRKSLGKTAIMSN